MRKKLEPYLNTYVLCKGWIKNWEDINEKQPQRRVYIDHPTIRKPNRDLRYEKLPIISTEHHLNLFINKKDIRNYELETTFEKYSPIEFSGFIRGYVTSNGSLDYGIYPTKRSLLHLKLNALGDIFCYLAKDPENCFNEDFYRFARSAKRKLKQLSEELEASGNQLPTFHYTYQWYRTDIDGWIRSADICIKQIETACSNRFLRRKNKIKEDFTKQYKC